MAKGLALPGRRLDWAISLLLIGMIAAYGAAFVDFSVPPFEDAAMLMRYADHLARGYGVVWNIGDPPVDGATDFLFMTAVASLIKFGLAIGRSVRIIGYAAHVLTVLLVYWVNRAVWQAGRFISLAAALYLAVGTGLWYVGAFFGTTFFALFAATTWSLGILLMKVEAPRRWLSVVFSVSALVMALVRPEGVILAGFIMLGVIVVKGWRPPFPTVLVFAAVLLLLGGAYFLWHWSYFGYPLPNPYYRKGGGLLHWDSFWESIGNLARFGGPFLLAFILGFRTRVTARWTIAFLVPLVAFAAGFVLVSNETNFGGRFQYALWPLILLSFYPLVAGLDREIGISWPLPPKTMPRPVWILLVLGLTYGLVRYAMLQSCTLTMAQQTCSVAYEADGRYEVANYLAQYQGRNYILATTEAGLLPLYSGWRTVDAWGLNDSWIAHNGEITPEYLDRYKPNAIIFHAYFSPLVPPRINSKNMQQDWFRMTLTLKSYAEANHYVLAAAFGDSPYEAHYYYVRRDFPDSEKIARAISAMKDYRWFATGRRAINYAGLQP